MGREVVAFGGGLQSTRMIPRAACMYFSLCDRARDGHTLKCSQVSQSGNLLACACDCDTLRMFVFAFLCVNRGSFIELCLSVCSRCSCSCTPSSQSVALACLVSALLSACKSRKVLLCWGDIHAAPSPPLGCFPSLPPPSVHTSKMAPVPCPGLQAVRSQNWTPGCLPGVGPL